ncbi:MAG: preprotein translocase subunit SecA, partial [Propionibacteriaceae bacterium]|nr:preprotein translocase subunit SecA [Propionibacteriaceae bacterium]
KNVLKYDDVMNRQRHTIYGDRRKVLEGADVDARLRDAAVKVVDQVVREHTEGFAEDWDLEPLWTQLRTLYPVGLNQADYDDGQATADELADAFTEDVERAYDAREEQLTPPVMREVERRVVLSVLDRKWREHLYEMDYLREGIGLRSMAQRDPLIEYQREGGDMFNAMMGAFLEESIGYVFNLEVNVTPQVAQAPQVGVVRGATGAPVDVAGAVPKAEQQLTYSGPTESGDIAVHAETDEDEASEPAEPAPSNRKQRRSNKKRR